MSYPASIELACLFKPSRGGHGANTTIIDLQRIYSGGQCIWYGLGKHNAFWLLMKRNMEIKNACGSGNRAARRAIVNNPDQTGGHYE